MKSYNGNISSYKDLADELSKKNMSEEQMDKVLDNFFKKNSIKDPWGEEDFDDFMSDKSHTLDFG